MKPKRSFILGFALLAVTFVALLILTTSTKYSRRSQRLPDGSSLKIVSISYGTNHSFAVPDTKSWERFLMAYLPSSWTTGLGWWWYPRKRVDLSPRLGETSIAIFTLCKLAKSNSFSALPKLDLCDERGTVYESAFEGAVLRAFRGKHRYRLVGWQFSRVPRDSRYLRLGFSEQSADGNTRQQVAEFSIPNPLVNGGTNSSR